VNTNRGPVDGVMINPDFRVEIHYSPTPEFPLPLSLSGICPFTNLYI
jgi:hypothetical protein